MTRPATTATRNDRKAPPLVSMIAFVLGIGLLVAGVYALVKQGSVEAGAAAPNKTIRFSLPDMDGRMVNLSDYQGRPVLINFWASWCPPCRAEMESLVEFHKQHASEGLAFLAIDTEDDRDKALKFMQAQSMPAPVLFDPDGKVLMQIGSEGLPTTLFVDRQGLLRFSWTGQISPSLLAERVAPLLSQ